MAPSSSESSPLQLAVAALIGASFMAISAFYVHKRSVDQILQRLIEIRNNNNNNKSPSRRRKPPPVITKLTYPLNVDSCDDDDDEEEEMFEKKLWKQGLRRSSSSLPNQHFMWKSDTMPTLLQNDQLHGSKQSCKNDYGTCQDFVARPSTHYSPGRNECETVEDFEEEAFQLPQEEDNNFLSDPINSNNMLIHDSISNMGDSQEVEKSDFAPDERIGAIPNILHGNASLNDNQQLETGSTNIARKDHFDVFIPLKTASHGVRQDGDLRRAP